MLIAAILASVALGQDYYVSKELGLDVKPLMRPPILAKLPLVSISEYVIDKGMNPVRVFRYTYRADMEAEAERLRALLTKDGWTMRLRQPGNPAVFFKSVTSKGLQGQTIVINSGKWIRAEGRPANTRVQFNGREKWVRISYNEQSATPYKG